LTNKRIALRGERENLYFVDKRKLRRGHRFGPEPVPNPWQRLRRWWRSRDAITNRPSASVNQPLG
jgi:hypothetical protein